jgi:hypothetical protein
MPAVTANRPDHRDSTMVLITYRRGPGAAELGAMNYERCSSTTPRAVNTCSSPNVSRRSRQKGVASLIEHAGKAAGFKFGVYPHMLRHSCGYKLANDGHDTRSLQATSVTKISSTRCVTLRCWRRGSKISGGIESGEKAVFKASRFAVDGRTPIACLDQERPEA